MATTMLAWTAAGIAAPDRAAAAPARRASGQGQTSAGPQAEPTPWDVTRARGETRVVEFTTDEGTYMSLDVSPDGRWIVFDLLGHVYRMPASGGQAECLTQDSGAALNVHPKYSPDGGRIAFVSDRGGQSNLWVMDSDGSRPRAVQKDLGSRAYEPEWMPDGEFVVVRTLQLGDERKPYKAALTLFHVDGGSGITLVEGSADWPSASPDGRFLYYHVVEGPPRASGHLDPLLGTRQIERYDMATGEKVPVTFGEAQQQARLSSGGAYAPEISPDGRFVAFARRIPDGTISWKGHRHGPRTALWLRDLDTGAERILADPIELDMAEGMKTLRILPGYAWTPDGRAIVVSRGGHVHRVEVATGADTEIPFTAAVRRTLSEQARARLRIEDAPFRARLLRWHTASPDGKRLAFHAVGRVWIQELPDGKPRRVTPASFEPFEYAPAWSPDGRTLAFTTWSETDAGHVWSVPAAGGTPRRLTREAGEYLHPVWSTDGTHIVVSRGSGATRRGRTWAANAWFDLVRLPASGGDPQAIVRVPSPEDTEAVQFAQVVRASIGPGGRVYFPQIGTQKAPDGRTLSATRLVSVRPDGSDRREHLVLPFADEVVVSPDGRHAAFQEGDEVYLLPVPSYTGGSPVEIDRHAGALPVKAISERGGDFPRFRDADTLEFGSGPDYWTYELASGKTTRVEVTLEVPRAVPSGRLALTGARIVTLDHRKVLEDASLVVEGARIACLGECDISGADRVVDVAGKTIIPGFVDMHSHHNREHKAIVPPHDYENAVYLAYGVTSCLDPFPGSQALFSAAELTEAGLSIGPRTFSTGDALQAGDGMRHNALDSYEATARNVERLVSWGATALKQYVQPRRDQHQWITDLARKHGLMVTAEGGSLSDNLGMIVDGQTGWEHPLSYVPVYADAAKFFGRAGAVYDPTFVVGGPGAWNEEYFYQRTRTWLDEKMRRWLPWRQLVPHTRRRMLRPETDYSYPMIAQGLADIVAEGGWGGIGSHGQHHGIAAHWEVWMAASALGPHGALEVASSHGARTIGIDRDTGSLEVGKLADLMVLDANPLEDIEHTLDMRYVMKGGVLYDAATLDEVWPEDRPFGPYYWVDEQALAGDDRPLR